MASPNNQHHQGPKLHPKYIRIQTPVIIINYAANSVCILVQAVRDPFHLHLSEPQINGTNIHNPYIIGTSLSESGINEWCMCELCIYIYSTSYVGHASRITYITYILYIYIIRTYTTRLCGAHPNYIVHSARYIPTPA